MPDAAPVTSPTRSWKSYVGFIGPNDELAGYAIATHLIVNEGRCKLVGRGV